MYATCRTGPHGALFFVATFITACASVCRYAGIVGGLDGLKRILLVEDEPFDQILFTRQLQRLRPAWDVQCVGTVRDAIAAIADDGFDMVVTDLTLPDARGPAAIEAMLTAVDGIPVVVVSGLDQDELGAAVDGHAVAAVQHKGRFDMAALAALID